MTKPAEDCKGGAFCERMKHEQTRHVSYEIVEILKRMGDWLPLSGVSFALFAEHGPSSNRGQILWAKRAYKAV